MLYWEKEQREDFWGSRQSQIYRLRNTDSVGILYRLNGEWVFYDESSSSLTYEEIVAIAAKMEELRKGLDFDDESHEDPETT